MTLKNGGRAATGTAKDSVRHAAEVVAPYAASAKEQCLHMAHEARERLGPRVSDLAENAQYAYGAHVAPQMRKARAALPDEVDKAAADTARKARDAAAYATPRIGAATAATVAAAKTTRAVAGPASREAAARGSAALSALKGEVRPEDVDRITARRRRRARIGRTARGALLAGVLGAAAFAAWRWWDRQVNPDWMVEPPEATEVAGEDSASMGHGESQLDPDVAAKQAESDLNNGRGIAAESGNPTDTSRAYYEREDEL